MTRFILTPLAVLTLSTVADAGPLRNFVGRVKERIHARPHVRQAACDFKQVAHNVATAPARLAEAKPVRTAFGNVFMTAGRVCGPNGCK